MTKHSLSTHSRPATEPAPGGPAPVPIPLAVRAGTLAAITIPALGLAAVPFLAWGWGFRWADLGLLLGMTVLTGLGITVGFHRLFTHRSFETAWPVQFALGVLGSMAVQGPLWKWVATHRRHHQHSDREGDPHSPHPHAAGLAGVLRGFWHAHVGWAFDRDIPGLERYVPDILRSRLLRTVSALFPLWVVLGLAVPAALGGLLSWSWQGAVLGLIWGGLVRVLLVHHVTWSINSACHLWGGKPHDCGDESRNNLIFGILAFGEGWHNNHHAFPTSARHGLRWWQFDASYLVIRG
ncbi:MAG TPA: acyl-CoA desaturase, partial [Gemmataceae bacterium]|nr:acyl-CoA desaturase [Gemmataceae bacterium]